MGLLSAPRFYADTVLSSCLDGHRIFQGSGDPPESVARVQQALLDLGFDVTVDGMFGDGTGTAVHDFKVARGLVPDDPVVGPGTMAALDAAFAHELFELKAAELAGGIFELGRARARAKRSTRAWRSAVSRQASSSSWRSCYDRRPWVRSARRGRQRAGRQARQASLRPTRTCAETAPSPRTSRT